MIGSEPKTVTGKRDENDSGMFDDAGSYPPLAAPTGESQELVIKVGRERLTVPVIVVHSAVVKRRRGRARWQVTMTQVGPGTWAQPQKKTAPKKKPR